MSATFQPGDRVRLRESVEVYGVKQSVFLCSKGAKFTVKGMFRGNVEIQLVDFTVTLPAKLLERC